MDSSAAGTPIKRSRLKTIGIGCAGILGICVLVGIASTLFGGDDEASPPTAPVAVATTQPTTVAQVAQQATAATSAPTSAPTQLSPTATARPQPTATTPRPTATARPQPTPTETGPKSSFGNGQHRVGTDIQPGLYWTPGTSSCYFARLKGFSGALTDIAANGNPRGQMIVQIFETDAGFQSNNCGTWQNITSLPVRADPAQPFGDGTWKVGDQIAPGTWRSEGTDTCYFARLSGFSDELDDIEANGNPRGPAVITIAPGDQGFTSQRCGNWTKVG